MLLGVMGSFEAADTMALETDCIYPGTSVANDVSPDDLRCRGRRYRTTSPRDDAFRFHCSSSSLDVRHGESLSLCTALTSQMDDRSSESDVQASQRRNRKRHQTWAICLPLNGQATPSVRGKASFQQTEASPVQSGQQNSFHNIAPTCRPQQIGAPRFLGLFRLITRSSTPTDLLLW